MKHETIIVGAGIAGLTLARRLTEKGQTPLVLEARARVGGRTTSFECNGTQFDLGATWVWQTEDAVLNLIDELGLRLYPSHRGGVDLFDAAHGVERVRLPPSSVPEFRVDGGTAAIARALAQDVDVRLSTRVDSVRANEDGVEVQTDAGPMHAEVVVLAVPPALAAPMIGEVPEAALFREVPVWMGDMAKVVAVFESPFWLDAGLSGRVFSHRGPMVEIHDISGPDREQSPALFGFVPKSFAHEGWRQGVRDQFARLFGEQAEAPTAMEIATWWEESATTPSGYTPNHQLMGHPMLARPLLGGRVHLCSTETAPRGAGHLDGAVRRAEALADLLTG